MRCAACAAAITELTCAAVAQLTVPSVSPVAGFTDVNADEAQAPCCQLHPSKTPGILEPGAGSPSEANTDATVVGSETLLAVRVVAACAAGVQTGSGMLNENGLQQMIAVLVKISVNVAS